MEAGNPVLLVHLSFFALTPTQWPRLYAAGPARDSRRRDSRRRRAGRDATGIGRTFIRGFSQHHPQKMLPSLSRNVRSWA